MASALPPSCSVGLPPSQGLPGKKPDSRLGYMRGCTQGRSSVQFLEP